MLQGAKILVVDDEKAMRLSLSEIFAVARSYRGQQRADGREAIELLNQRDFDLMMLDLKMPGMSGNAGAGGGAKSATWHRGDPAHAHRHTR